MGFTKMMHIYFALRTRDEEFLKVIDLVLVLVL
jgi:hypothetical protein